MIISFYILVYSTNRYLQYTLHEYPHLFTSLAVHRLRTMETIYQLSILVMLIKSPRVIKAQWAWLGEVVVVSVHSTRLIETGIYILVGISHDPITRGYTYHYKRPAGICSTVCSKNSMWYIYIYIFMKQIWANYN